MRASKNPLARLHALWTLEGLGSLDAALARQLLNDADSGDAGPGHPRERESLYKAGDSSLAADWRAVAEEDQDTDVVIQAMLTLNHLKVPGTAEVVASVRELAQGTRHRLGRRADPETARGGRTGRRSMTPARTSTVERGATAYAESCFACHGENGRGAPMPGGRGLRAPALAGSPRVIAHRDYVIRTMLHGLSGPLDGRTYAEVMAPMARPASSDRWIADVASFIRNGFGNSASVVTEADVARVRKSTAGRDDDVDGRGSSRTLPQSRVPDATWRATASHNTAAADGAFDYARWSSDAPQQPGMWFQIELPEPVTVIEVQFDSPVTPGRKGSAPASTAPRAYRVEVSGDGKTWSDRLPKVRAEGGRPPSPSRR